MKFRKLKFGKRRAEPCFNQADTREPEAGRDMGRDYGAGGNTKRTEPGYGRENDYASQAAGGCSRDPSRDKGNAPCVFNIATDARLLTDRMQVIWTGKHIQIAVKRISASVEAEPVLNEGSDMAMYVAWGEGRVALGRHKSNMSEWQKVCSGSEILIPEGAYYSIVCDKMKPLDIILHCAPKKYPFGYTESD